MTTPAATDTLFRPILRLTGRAITDYAMIGAGDHVMVCVSGGKDSYTLLDALLHFQRAAPIDFRVTAVNLDQGQPGFPTGVLPRYLSALGVAHDVIRQDTYSVVRAKVPAGRTTCALCSRLRRGALYAHARRIGATKIALGHHREDILETFLMNLFHGARLKAMPPKLQSDDGTNVVIRPLAYVPEADIAAYARARAFPIIPCDLCGAQPNLQREVVGQMLQAWEREHPGRLNTVLRALATVDASHLLDRALFDFAGLGTAPAQGDTAFDGDDMGVLAGVQELPMLD
ncbi:tRNA 2-thiocytidine biosynthesis protein TtcA [Deinococcus metalli]|uniref:tRNA-cytidine(32) 2-sulfurtransferase n=1 Tax=Deinococcus metalli TaxID=1141878 RepID=A0A7W8NS55_9DEIO|nr:tRNA 2-thiocytidine(32) synthetase TtcA [Deinococcus metalli]MBB5377628.1 tRNA 2-thiocytidine biosynthesis protein TtcA [Deinococcus metalli]GHF52158.1 tRNA 2-thiocytidine biosynthesis protein TtcA [Deinococcus metalli]